MRAMVSNELLFWGVMSLGAIVGFTAAYPSKVWMVARGMKHGLMTVRGVYAFFAHLKWAIALGYAASIWLHFQINGNLFER